MGWFAIGDNLEITMFFPLQDVSVKYFPEFIILWGKSGLLASNNKSWCKEFLCSHFLSGLSHLGDFCWAIQCGYLNLSNSVLGYSCLPSVSLERERAQEKYLTTETFRDIEWLRLENPSKIIKSTWSSSTAKLPLNHVLSAT